MSDTQWPRYVVFEQDFERNPHKLAGSVHAPDAELAMFNARDVFVRRPTVISLWVARAETIFAKTREELVANPDWGDDLQPAEGEPEPYLVFGKPHHRGTHEYLGEVQAADPPHALAEALQVFGGAEPIVWWVLPARALTKSTPEDIELLFEQAKDKPFRHQSNFRVATRMRAIKERESGEQDEV